MSKLPHQYSTTVCARESGHLDTTDTQRPCLSLAPPLQFGGPGDQWSPEDLLMASLSSCLILSFRAIAKAAHLPWVNIECNSTGTLDKVERHIKFTQVDSTVTLTVESDDQREQATKLLEKAEQTCFISNSLNCPAHATFNIVVQPS